MLLILYRHALRVYITTIHRQFGLKPNIIYILYASHIENRGFNFSMIIFLRARSFKWYKKKHGGEPNAPPINLITYCGYLRYQILGMNNH